jgi:hypothetical protein
MDFFKNIRDPIHGFIGLTESELSILDSIIMQRLRRIKQLANAHLLYPVANHTRFEHSLGCMHLSWKIARKITINEENQEILRMASLVHDIGHGPYSHPFEDSMKEIGLDYDHDSLRIDILRKYDDIIEEDSCREDIVRFLEYINGNINETDLETEKEWPAMRSILSSPVDADKMDYLLRDAYFCGVDYGKFDISRILLKIMSYTDEPIGTKYLGICSSAHDAAVMVWISRLMMNRQVYLHKVRAISDLMTKRMISLAYKNGFLEERSKPLEIFDHLKDYSDYSLMDKIIKNDYCENSTYYVNCLKNRILFKLVERRRMDAISETNKSKLIKYDTSKDMSGRRSFFEKIEREFAEMIDIDPEHVIIDRHMGHVKKPKGDFLVIDKITGERRNFFETSPIDQKEEDKEKDNILILVPKKYIESAKEKIGSLQF